MKKTSKEVKNTETITQSLAPVKKSKHNYKLSEEDKQSIVLEYYLNRSKQNIDVLLDKYSISKRTLYDLLKKEKYQKEVNRYITECKQNFTKKSTILIDKALDKINEKIEENEASVKDLTTTLGILYDKNRLEQNLSTSNNSININLKIER